MRREEVQRIMDGSIREWELFTLDSEEEPVLLNEGNDGGV